MKKLAMMFVCAMLLTQSVYAQFYDIDNDPAQAKIESLEARGLIYGTAQNVYSPQKPVTRAEFAAMVNRAMGYTKKGTASFTDVKNGDWFFDDVCIAANMGIIDGFPDRSFKPHSLVTHEQAVKILVAVYQSNYSITPSGDMATYFDDYYEISDWARSYITKGAMLNIAKGYTNLTGTVAPGSEAPVNENGSVSVFNPKGYTTRSQAADMIFDLLEVLQVSQKINR